MIEALGHLLGAAATVYFAHTVFSGRGKSPSDLLVATLGIVLTTLIVGWPIHPAAGMLLGLLFPMATKRRDNPTPMFYALGCAAAFAVLGAEWVIVPAAIAAFLWLMSGNATRRTKPQASAEALPQEAGGLPMVNPIPEGETVHASPPIPTSGKRSAAVSDKYAELDSIDFQETQKLPAEAQKLLAEIDSVTLEALGSLNRQGQTAGQATYQLQAIRNEYVPNVVQGYVRLPPTLADVTPLDGEKTGRDLLLEQLELLLHAAQELLSSTALAGSRDLLTNGRFLREKFGTKNKEWGI